MGTNDDDDFISNVRLGDNLNIVYPNSNEIFTNSKINLLYMNINSIRNKIEDLMLYLAKFKSTIHIICITEMRLNPDEIYMCNIPSYNVVCCPRSNRLGGGACMFIHESMEYDVMKNEEFLEGSCIIVSLREPRLDIAVVYRPPHANLNDTILYLDSLLESAGKLICVGDFNINLLNTTSNAYVSMVESNGFTFLNRVDNDSATHGINPTGTIIDHAFTNIYYLNFGLCIDDISFTDHKSLLISFDSQNSLSRSNKSTNVVKYNYASITADLTHLVESAACLNSFNQLIKNCMSKNSYQIRTCSRYQAKAPWIDETVLGEIRYRDQLYRRTLQWPDNLLIQQNYRKQKNYVTRLIKQKQKTYYQNQIVANRSNIRKVWSILNEIVFRRKTKQGNSSISKILLNDRVLEDSVDICNAFNSYFINIPHELLYNLDQKFNNEPRDFTLNRSIANSIVILPASANEVGNYIRSLKNSNAAGVDGILSKVIKQNLEIIVQKLTSLINQSIADGVFPYCLKSAKIVPIYKSGCKTGLGNYRPISVLPVLSKPFEKIIQQRLCSFFDRHKIISKNQYGFQQNSNTTSATVNLINEIQVNLDERKLCSAIFIDVSKAFDCVSHTILLKKLHQYGIRNKAFSLIESYLNNRCQCVSINNHTSRELTVDFGVPQGSILGPLLFNVYVNDIFDLPLKGKLQLFADDAALVYNANSFESLYQDMQHDLNLLQQWFFNNGLTVNASKTKYIIFRKNDQLDNIYYDLWLSGEKLERVVSLAYLGLIVQQSLRWNLHVEHIHKKISKFLGMLRQSSYMIPLKERKNLFYAHVNSQICYLCIIWQNAPNYVISKISITLNKFMRTIFWEDYLDPNVRTVDLYKNNYIMNFAQLKYFESALFVYKVKNNLIKHNLELQSLSELHRFNTRNMINIQIRMPRTNYIKLGCIYPAIINYNNLPLNLKTITSIHIFKNSLKKYVIENII